MFQLHTQGGSLSGPAAAAAAAAGEPRIRVDGLGKNYGTLEVFKSINLDVGNRESGDIIGSSGCGKTTLLGRPEPRTRDTLLHPKFAVLREQVWSTLMREAEFVLER